jgi:phosphoadenosine phosphosulfate reductase family protein
MKHILSYGGGLNSTALLVFLIKNHYPLDLVLFADTGSEFDHTYKTVQIYKEYCLNHNIPFVIVKSDKGVIYDYYFNKKITPNRMKRDCTTKFKITPIRQYIRKNYPKEKFVFYIGIDYDEAHRMRDSDVKYIENKYPLVDNKINRSNCISLLQKEGLYVPQKSGCYFCPFTKKAGWVNLKRHNIDLFNKSMKLEQNSSRYPEPVSLLSSKPLVNLTKNSTLEEYMPSCDVTGSCFL